MNKFLILNRLLEAGEMDQHIEVLVPKPSDLILIPGPTNGRSQLASTVVLPHKLHGIHTTLDR